MQTSGIPIRVAVPFADSGTKNTIPVTSQVSVTPGLASYTTGFPPLTMTPVTAGGVPPYGADFNGILNAITNAIRWLSSGSSYPFDSAFSSTVAGYPKGALVPASDFSGYWLNTQESNNASPENTTSEISGWVPGVHYGVTAITGMASTSVTLTTLQAAKPRITLSGSLTANVNLIFPAWVRGWTVVNNCTGVFSVICKTPSGAGVAVANGITVVINGDGTNITQDSNYLQSFKNLSDLTNVSQAISNLGLGSAALRTVGTGTNQIPDMSSWTDSFSSSGWRKTPDGYIEQWGVSAATTTDVSVNFPIPFPSGSVELVEHDLTTGTNTTVSIWQFRGLTTTGFLAMNLGSITRGSTTINAAIVSGCRWFAKGK